MTSFFDSFSRIPLFRSWLGLSVVSRWRIVLGLLGGCLVIWLLAAEKPWHLPAAEKMKLSDTVALWSWWAALLDLIVVAGLFVLCPWWAGRPVIENPKSQIPNPNGFWPLVLTAVVLAGIFAVPRLGFGLWDDEELSARQAIVGKFKTDKETGAVRFVLHDWHTTLYDYRTPNNHVLHSLLSRASLDAWRAAARPSGLPFAEWPMRIPALVFGLLAVVATAWFLREMGFPATGVVAAFLMAMHPWCVRYASEARAYSMVLCLVPVLFVCWHRAVTLGSWRWWGALGVVQFALMNCYPGVLFLLVVLNALTLPVLAWSKGAAGPFVVQSGRWFCVNSLAAAGAFLFIMPLLPQAKIYFDLESKGVTIGWYWAKRTLAYLMTGGQWTAPAGYPAVNLPAAGVVVFGVVLGILLVVGLVRFVRRGSRAGALAVTILASPLLTIAFARFRGMFIYENYIIFVLPGLVALVALGIWTVAERFRRLPAGRLLVPAAATVLVLGYFSVTFSVRQWLVRNPLQQIPESVLACRGTLDPKDDAGILTASFCIPPYLYDGHMVRTDSVAEFIEVMRRADRENKPLWVNIGMPWAAEQYNPGMWALFNTPELFADHRTFRGWDPGLDRIVARYRPGSAAQFDFSAHPLDGR